MRATFIKEAEAESFKDKLLLIIKILFNKIDIIKNENTKIYIVPITNKIKCSRKMLNRLNKRIVKSLGEDGISSVVLSEQLKNIDLLKNNLYSQNINILDGRYLFKVLSIQIIEYILKVKNENIENSEITILVNDFNSLNKDIIIDIAKRVKTLNIITNKINKFKKVEKYLYEEYGIILNISNNKKTSLLKAKIILNFDFPEEIINQYKINSNCIIVNIIDKIEIYSKKFNGININDYIIDIPNAYIINGFKDEEVYESIIYNYGYNELKIRIKQDDISINCLIGNRGIISKEEFMRIIN